MLEPSGASGMDGAGPAVPPGSELPSKTAPPPEPSGIETVATDPTISSSASLSSEDAAAAFEQATQWAREVSRPSPVGSPTDGDPLASTEDDLDTLFDEGANPAESGGSTPDIVAANIGESVQGDGGVAGSAAAVGNSPAGHATDEVEPASAGAGSVADKIILSTLHARLREAEGAYAEVNAKLSAARSEAAAAGRVASEREADAESAHAEAARLTAELEQLSAALDTAKSDHHSAEAEAASLRAGLALAQSATDAAKTEAAAAREEAAAAQAQRDADRAAVAEDRARALATATAGMDEKTKLELATAKAELERVWQDKLDAAVTTERRRWENKYNLLQTDYKEIEPRYKAMMQQLEHKLANVEFDATMLLASKEKWKADLKDERAKHKTTRKSLKKSRTEVVDLLAQVDRAKQREAELLSTMATKEEARESASAQATAALGEATAIKVELQERNCDVTRLQQEVARLTAEWESINEENSKTMGLLQEARSEHAKTREELNAAEEQLAEGSLRAHKSAAQMKAKEAAITDVESTLKATMLHCEEQRREIEAAQAESAALAAVAASAALTLANAGSTLNQVCSAVESKTALLQKLAVPALKVRTVQFDRRAGTEVGFVLAYDETNQAPGIRVSSLVPDSPAAAVGGALGAGDVLIAVCGELVLESTLDAVSKLLEKCGPVVEVSVVSADELDDDESPFWQQGDAAASDDEGESASEAATSVPSKEDVETAAPSTSKPSGDIVDSATEAVRSRSQVLTTQITALQRATDLLSSGVITTKGHVESLSTKLSVSRRRASSMAEKLRVSTQDLDNTSAALAMTVLDLEEKQEALRAAENEREIMDSAIQSLGTQLAEATTQATSNAIQASTARELCNETQSFKAEADAEILRLTEALTEMTAARDEAIRITEREKTAASDARAIATQLETDFAALNKTYVERSQEKKLAMEGESAMSAELINLTATYTAELEAAESKVALATERLREAEEQGAEFAQKYSERDTACTELEAEFGQLKVQHESLVEEHETVKQKLADETEEREHLEAGLGEAINALALAQGDKAKVAVLEKQIESHLAELQEVRSAAVDLQVKLEMAHRDVEAEKENVQFAQELLQQAGSDRASLEAELDDSRKDSENVKILLRAAEQQQLNERRAADSHLLDHAAESSTLKSRLRDVEAILKSERNRIKELEALLTVGLSAKERLESAVAAQHERLKQLVPPEEAEAMSDQPQALSVGDGGVVDGAHAYHSTNNIIRAFKVFGMITRNVIVEVPRKGGLGMELARDPDSGYVTVSALRADGAASKSGEVNVGDCIICVNGHFMLDVEYTAVIAAINRAARRLSLVLGSPEQMFESTTEDGAPAESADVGGKADADDGWA